jgi:nucleoside-diphosphate-sugar epimerase
MRVLVTGASGFIGGALCGELGWQPRFPTAREGVADVVARLLAGA